MNRKERARLRELASKATPGEWYVKSSCSRGCWCVGIHTMSDDPDLDKTVVEMGLQVADADFIVEAQAALPAALDALDERDQREAELRETIRLMAVESRVGAGAMNQLAARDERIAILETALRSARETIRLLDGEVHAAYGESEDYGEIARIDAALAGRGGS